MALPRSRQPAFSREEEADLILRCQGGDSTAFRTLVERYGDRAFWVAYHLVGHAEDAQDIVQEAFIRAYRALPTFRVGERFYTWFYQIVVHLSVDLLRQRREHRQLPHDGNGLSAREAGPLERMEQEDFAQRVHDLLQGLSPRERAILVLRDLEGFSGKEIADITGSNQATVRWWLFQARRRFRAEWERRFGNEGRCS